MQYVLQNLTLQQQLHAISANLERFAICRKLGAVRCALCAELSVTSGTVPSAMWWSMHYAGWSTAAMTPRASRWSTAAAL